jgi:hypothetical protein
LLSARERRVVQLWGKKLTQAAKEMGILLPLASRLRRRALQRLQRAIEKGTRQMADTAKPALQSEAEANLRVAA